MPEEVLFAIESTRSRADVAAYLRTIADRLDADGQVTLRAGEESIILDVPANPTFEVKVERETPRSGGPGEQSLELELEWDEDDGSDGSFEIE